MKSNCFTVTFRSEKKKYKFTDLLAFTCGRCICQLYICTCICLNNCRLVPKQNSWIYHQWHSSMNKSVKKYLAVSYHYDLQEPIKLVWLFACNHQILFTKPNCGDMILQVVWFIVHLRQLMFVTNLRECIFIFKGHIYVPPNLHTHFVKSDDITICVMRYYRIMVMS